MDDNDRIRRTIWRVIDAMNEEFPEGQRLDKSPSAALFGPKGSLDSLGLVDLVMRIQETVLDEYGVAVAVANEDVLLSPDGPFRTVETLTDHVAGLLENVQPPGV